MLKNKPSSTSLGHGFTIVEMLIIAPIVILTIGAFVTVIVNMTGDVLATRSSNVLAYSIQDALNRIEDDVKLSTTFLEANNVSLAGSHQGFDDNVANFANVDNGTNGNMLILNTLATTGNPLSPTSGLIYLTGQPNACGATQNQNTPMTMNVIYFVKNNTLWRRTIMPSNYAAGLTVSCNIPWQQPSCAPGVTDSFCKTQDVRLVDNLKPSDFVVQYFNTADATAANSAAVDPTSASNRHVALQSTQTASATINTSKTVAGRQISQAGTMRATRLDINSSTIADIVVATTPATPTVTASFSVPNTANFTWPAVPGATSYTVNYNIAGGTYVNGSTGSVATSFSMTAANNQSVCATVYAVNSAGTSAASGPTCMTIPLWNGLVYQNNWSDYGNGYATGAYTMTSSGVVVIKGLTKRAGTPSSGEAIAILPVGYRPSEALMFGTSTGASGGDTTARIDINTNGAITYATGSGNWLSLEKIMFIPSATSYAWSALTPFNGWVNFNSGFASAGYTRDSAGHVFIKGLVANGTTTDGTPIVTVPSGYSTDSYLHIASTSNNTFDDVGVDTSGNIVAKGNALNSYKSLQISYLPPGYATWYPLTLQSGWLPRAGFAVPSYAKTADGIVTVRGLIDSGNATAGLTITNLPPGYRPKETHIFEEACVNAYCRMDVYPDGRIVAGGGVSTSWSSLDSISFMAEQ